MSAFRAPRPAASAAGPGAASAGRKRRRLGGGEDRRRREDRLRSYGVDLPDIDGMPVELIPIHVRALKAATNFFDAEPAVSAVVAPAALLADDSRREEAILAEGAETGSASTRRPETAASGSGPAVLEGIIRRMGESSTAVSRGDAAVGISDGPVRRQQQQRLVAKNESVRAWVEAVHRHVKDANARRVRHQGTSHEPSGEEDQRDLAKSAAVVCLEHLWGRVMDDKKKIAVRRAGLHLASHLLARSAECRGWLLDVSSSSSSSPDILLDWLNETSRLSRDNGHLTNERQGTRQASTMLLQRESFLLLQQLERGGYGDLYSALQVAVMRFEQQNRTICDSSGHNPFEAAGGDDGTEHHGGSGRSTLERAAYLRRSRDEALQNYLKEEAAVRRLLLRAGACMDVIVPRFGAAEAAVDRPRAELESQRNCNHKGDDNGDNMVEDEGKEGSEDDDVDWEDGEFSEREYRERPPGKGPSSASHAEAVERTLAAIEATGGVKAGEIEIAFGDPSSTTGNDDDYPPMATATPAIRSSMDAEKTQAMARLASIARRLSARHLPRLKAWTRGLVEADGLVERSTGSGNSFALVAMPSDLARRRKQVLDRVIELKVSVASVLGSARRLGIDAHRDETNPRSAPDEALQPPPRPPPRMNLAGGTAGQSASRGHPRRLASTLDRRRLHAGRAGPIDTASSRSNRIQVKYRKS